MKHPLSHGKRLILFFLLVLAVGPLSYPGPGEGQNSGLRYFRNYSPADYSSSPQNWGLLQARWGLIYAANQGGLLQYDGVSWNDSKIPNYTVRSLALDDTGTLYLGGVNEIGYMAPDAGGSLKYKSLRNHLGEKERDFSYVWKSYWTKEGIYFRTSKYLFRWHPGNRQMKTWRPLVPGSVFDGSFTCRGRLFIRQKDLGLIQMKDHMLQLVPGGEIFATKTIYAMFPYNDRELVIGTRTDGLFRFDGKKMLPFPTEADDYLEKKKLSYGIRLFSSPGHFALGTSLGGLVIIDARGRLKEVFTRASGLQDDKVNYVFEDKAGSLWLALDKGISKIEYASPISIYDDRSNLPEIVQSVTRHGPHRDLYVGTNKGLYCLPGEKGDTFYPVPGMSGMCYALLSCDGPLLVATTGGLFQVDTRDKKTTFRKVIDAQAYFLLRSPKEPNRIWVNTSNGLFSLRREKDRWQEERKFENITIEQATMVEDKKGSLWLGTLSGGVIKIDFPTGGTGETVSDPKVNRYHTAHGLPPGEVGIFWAAGHVIASGKKGIFRFDERKNLFIPDYTLDKDFADAARHVFYISEDKKNNIWFTADFRVFQAVPQPGGGMVINSKSFLRLPRTQVNAIYPDPNGVIVWFATNEGLVRYNTTVKKNYSLEFRALIRKVQKLDDKSAIFDGHPAVSDEARSEERRVGKECRSRWSPYH